MGGEKKGERERGKRRWRKRLEMREIGGGRRCGQREKEEENGEREREKEDGEIER